MATAKKAKWTRWTEDQVATMNECVKSARTAKEGFAIAAEKLGKSPGTVQMKYYSLLRAAKKPKKQTTSAPNSHKKATSPAMENPYRTVAVMRNHVADALFALRGYHAAQPTDMTSYFIRKFEAMDRDLV